MERILKERKDIEKSLTWDLSTIYKTDEEYEIDVKKLKELALDIERDYKGKLNTAENINKCLNKLGK